jgi:cation transport ATPase
MARTGEEGMEERGQDAGNNSDYLADLFSRPVFLSLTIGIPFCTFKLLFGITAFRVGSGLPDGSFAVAGIAIAIWALGDLVMNTGRALYDLAHREARFEYCTIAQIGAFFGVPSVFLALDTLVTFIIICAMLWSGWITLFSRLEAWFWYAATTLNLISLSLVLLHAEIRRAESLRAGSR